MAGKSRRAKLTLTAEERQNLQSISHSRTASVRKIQRAQILLAYADQKPIVTIARLIGATRQTVYKCIDKALEMGWKAGLLISP